MFSVTGDIIYYDGKPFAVITATATRSGGWIYDAINALDDKANIPVDEFAGFATSFTRDLKDKIDGEMTKAISDLWLPEVITAPLSDRLNTSITEFFRDEAENELGVTFNGE